MKRLGILLALAALVWGGVYLLEQQSDEDSQPAAGPWMKADPADVSRLAVNATMDFALIRDERGENEWRVELPELPESLPGKTEPVESLIAFIADNPPKRRLGPPAAMEPYGLLAPSARVSVEGDFEGDQFELILGDRNPSGDGAYALEPATGELLLMPPQYLQQFSKPAAEFFDLRLTAVQPDDVQSLTLASGATAWTLAGRAGERRFSLPPEAAEVDVDVPAVELYLQQALSAEARSIAFEEPPTNATEPALQLEIVGADESEMESIRIFETEAGLFIGEATRLAAPFYVDREVVSGLKRSVFQLKDRRVAKLDIGRIKRVELAAGERTLVASKTEQSWTDANGEPVAGIDMALWRLTDLKYDQEPRAASESFSEAVLTVSLFDDQNAPIAAYSFLNDETSAPGSVLLQVHGETTLYPVSDELLNDLQALTPAADE